jgi:two-component system, NarL family, nitrate/nitrite response regulator NarL
MSCATKAVLTTIRVFLLGEHALIRAGLRMLIESRSGLAVVGEASNYADARAAGLHEADIILLDSDLDPTANLDFLQEMVASENPARLLILTGTADLESHYCAVRLGAMGLVLKESPAEVLVKAIEKVHAGEVWLDRSAIARVLRGLSNGKEDSSGDPDGARIANLTERERNVIEVIGEGLKNKLIAERLFISETTVRHHLSSIFEKLGVSDRFELLVYAYRHKLAKPPI